jgi:3-phosphoshikimate 1-carboxyvinyltransferase
VKDLYEIRPAAGPLQATVRVPGSKSYTQRALIAAALAQGVSRLEGPLLAEDTQRLMAALEALGAKLRGDGEDVVVAGTAGRIKKPDGEIYLGNNGTALRFLLSLAALGNGEVILTGDARLCERPVGPLLAALADLGVDASSGNGSGCPPVTIRGRGIAGGTTGFTDAESSQYISSLLLCAPYAARDVSIRLAGKTVSEPYIAMTRQVMADFGVTVEHDAPNAYLVRSGQRYRARHYAIEGDVSSATYFFLAPALCGGKVTVEGIVPGSGQGDLRFLDLLGEAGCRIDWGTDGVTVEGGALTPGDCTVSMGDMPDAVPTMAVLAAFRPGRTVITGVSHLRLKESNRLAALAAELNKIGAAAQEMEDGLAVTGGGPLRGGEIETYNDHRIAMSFAMAGLALPGMAVRNPLCVAKSFPRFWDVLAKLQGE